MPNYNRHGTPLPTNEELQEICDKFRHNENVSRKEVEDELTKLYNAEPIVTDDPLERMRHTMLREMMADVDAWTVLNWIWDVQAEKRVHNGQNASQMDN